ncbi:hypothetical protein GR925_27450 [Streptomyces sp. HUCO-GS316]|uniref:hypothetical protein n=1 Tax=Streptomyces sp. HUCO-GS316 TaxID=2692198 RepID=UPI00136DBF7B|nr:hypothetical protein [Streptomyces sp. HUCO-GS316]MXM67065.1 hypothetical protein [Streptomyces sp. HUCO-GS316]
MTHAQVVALRDAGQLRVDCHYVISDWVQGTTLTGPNLVELHATSPSVLSMEAKVFTPYDNEAWEGLYDIDRGTVGQLVELRDNLNNVVRDTTGTSAIVGTFPWGTALWSENYLDSVTLTAPATGRAFQRNTVKDSTLDMTGWASGSWTQSDVRASTVTTGATFTMTNSEAQSSTITGEATGSISLTLGTKVLNSSVLQDSGSLKQWSISSSELRTVVLRGQGGTVARSALIISSRLRGRGVGDSITFLGETSLNLTSADLSFNNTWTVDGAAGSSVNIRECTCDQVGITRAAAAGRLDVTNGQYSSTFIDMQGSGALIVQACRGNGGVLRTGAGSSGQLNVNTSSIEGGTVEVLGVRSLSLNSGTYVGASATVTESGTTATAVAAIGDRVDQSRIEAGAVVQFATTTGTGTNQVTRSVVRGSSLVSPAGRLRIEGLTDGAWVDACRVYGGTVTITDAGTSLSGPSAFHDNQVDAGATLTYTGGDSTARQIRNNHVAGLSTLTLTSLTGSAGGGLGDVFAMSVRGQSTLTVTGARVPGQPIRDCTVEQGSTLNIPASGCTQRCRVAGGATLNAGAFVHFDSEMSLAATKTLTAANVNRLANKAYDDMI